MNPTDRIGALLSSSGCFFRVWAPHARTLAVLIQDGPYWETGDVIVRQDLVRDGDYWSGTVPGVRAMVEAIEKEKANAVVPAWPWVPLGKAMRHLPLPLVRKIV